MKRRFSLHFNLKMSIFLKLFEKKKLLYNTLKSNNREDIIGKNSSKYVQSRAQINQKIMKLTIKYHSLIFICLYFRFSAEI